MTARLVPAHYNVWNEQRTWAKQRGYEQDASASAIVRVALARLMADVDGAGVDLTKELELYGGRS